MTYSLFYYIQKVIQKKLKQNSEKIGKMYGKCVFNKIVLLFDHFRDVKLHRFTRFEDSRSETTNSYRKSLLKY